MKISDGLRSYAYIKATSHFFAEMSVGEKIQATIIAREKNTAILNIKGVNIKAEFTSGVPEGERVELILQEKTPQKISFIISPLHKHSELSSLLMPLSIFVDDEFYSLNKHSIIKLLLQPNSDIYKVNLSFLALKGFSVKDTGILFEKLMEKMGIKKTLLLTLFINPSISFFYEMSLIYENSLYRNLRDSLRNEESRKELIEDTLRDCESDRDIFDEIMDLLFGKNIVTGQFPFFSKDKISWVRFLKENNSLFLSFELSNLGEIATVIKDLKKEISVSVFSNEEAKDFMENRRKLLNKKLYEMNIKNVTVNFYNAVRVMEKIKSLCERLYSEGDFDVKI